MFLQTQLFPIATTKQTELHIWRLDNKLFGHAYVNNKVAGYHRLIFRRPILVNPFR